MPIQVLENRVFHLQTQNTSYVMLWQEDALYTAHWGGSSPRAQDYLHYTFPENRRRVDCLPEECSSFGTMHFKETSLKLRYADGTRDFRYTLDGWEQNGEHLCIRLRDTAYPLTIKLHYRVHAEYDVIEKWREACWEGEETLLLERFHSAEFGLEGTGYRSLNCNGRWGAEFLMEESAIVAGKTVYESLFGLTSHMTNPFFVLHKNADEENGDVYFGALAWSGNFKIVAEATPHDYTSILAGMSDTDFELRLAKGDAAETPHVYAGYTKKGLGTMSRTLHAFAREKLMPEPLRKKPLPVLYNSWYATTFDVRVEEQVALAEKAAAMGVELFVVDDGWFKGRDDDTAALGDWTPDAKKFSQGLSPLIDRVKALGMTFGLWIEPEMTNENSDLFRAHPEWVLQYKNRPIITGRNQYYLDFANPDVVDHMIAVFDTLLSENDIAYIKWDMNRYASEMGSPTRLPETFKEMWRENTLGVYRLIETLRERHPQVEFESCASGGGRVDFGALERFDEYWPSDNTDPLDRLFIQQDYSLIYPAKYMRAWLTDDAWMGDRIIPVRFGMHCAMCGALGIGVNLNEKDESQRAEMTSYISEYKQVRDTVQFGDLYRLKSLKTDSFHAVQYVRGTQSVVFAFLERELYGMKQYRLRLRGLKPETVYSFTLDGEKKELSGAFLMEDGLLLTLKGDYSSLMLVLEAIG